MLIVDSENTIRNMIKDYAVAEGYFADEAVDGIAALKLFRRYEYSLVILDTLLAELDGRNVCRQIRKVSDVPIIMVSTEKEVDEKLSCFELGADDYVIKPFSPLELMARIKVFLRRGNSTMNVRSRNISYDGIYIDTFSRTVYIDEKPVQLTHKDYDLLLFLCQNPNRAFPRDALLNEVWGPEFFGSDRTIDTHIKTLRENIKPYHDYITTIWGFGYKFEI